MRPGEAAITSEAVRLLVVSFPKVDFSEAPKSSAALCCGGVTLNEQNSRICRFRGGTPTFGRMREGAEEARVAGVQMCLVRGTPFKSRWFLTDDGSSTAQLDLAGDRQDRRRPSQAGRREDRTRPAE